MSNKAWLDRHFRRYSSFAELSSCEAEGEAFSIEIARAQSGSVLVAAPHAGDIEWGTGTLAKAVAGTRFSSYIFYGSHPRLHLTSTKFDEPRFISIAASHRTIAAIHGCREREIVVFLGGRSHALKALIQRRLALSGINAISAQHRFLALESSNLCNRGSSGEGVQIEISVGLRNDPYASGELARALAACLVEFDA
jgi:phage replication-related protein YjqB (UPF0714/DUF867 family)